MTGPWGFCTPKRAQCPFTKIVGDEFCPLNPSAFFQVRMLQKGSILKYKLSSEPESAVLILLHTVGVTPNSKAGFFHTKVFLIFWGSDTSSLGLFFWLITRHCLLRWISFLPFTGSNTDSKPRLSAHRAFFSLCSVSDSLLRAATPPLHNHLVGLA